MEVPEASSAPELSGQALREYRQRAWLIVAVLFVEGMVTAGSAVTGHGPWVAPLLKRFALTHARISLLFSTLTIVYGICSVPTGWLLDRIAPQWVLSAGALVTATGFFLAGRAATFNHLLMAYVVLGIGVGATGIAPISVTIANWFTEGRGLAMGIGAAGATGGGMFMTIAGSYLIFRYSIATSYYVLSLLVLVLALPLILLVVRPSPLRAGGGRAGSHHAGLASLATISGATVSEAVRTAGFWVILIAQGAVMLSIGVVLVHTIPYMIQIGFTCRGSVLGWASSGSLVRGSGNCGMAY